MFYSQYHPPFCLMTKKTAAKTALREFLKANIGRVLTHDELRTAALGTSEWGRRLRELRDEEGYPIKSHRDDDTLRPGEYRIDSLELAPVAKRAIDKKVRAQVMSDAGGMCEWCGAEAGKPHPDYPEKITRLQVAHIVDKAKGGTDDLSNLRALCSFCNEGASIETTEPPAHLHLSKLIRRAPRDVARRIYEELRKKYEPNGGSSQSN